jgi:hypothetical protein
MTNEIGDPKVSTDDMEIDDVETKTDDDIGDGTTIVLDETGALTDNVGDVSVEINVEELIADIEASEDEDVHRKKEIRQRLEEMAEEKSFEDTYAIDVDKEPKAK